MAKKFIKVAAALGVVAGLGIAALPLSSYADTATASDILVSLEILETVGTVEPTCDDDISPVTGSGGAGESINGSCGIGGSSNVGIIISIKDKDSVTNLTHTNTVDFIPALGASANIVDGSFNFAGGVFGWGYRFVSGNGSLLVASGKGNFNGITASDSTVASSAVGVTLSPSTTGFRFRAVTPADQAPGVYSDTAVVTVAINE